MGFRFQQKLMTLNNLERCRQSYVCCDHTPEARPLELRGFRYKVTPYLSNL